MNRPAIIEVIGQDLERWQAENRLDELAALGMRWARVERMPL